MTTNLDKFTWLLLAVGWLIVLTTESTEFKWASSIIFLVAVCLSAYELVQDIRRYRA